MGTKSKPGKSKKKGGMGYSMAVLVALAIILPALANRSEAGVLGWNPDPYQLQVGVPSLQTDPDSISNRGAALMVNYGSLLKADLGTNRILLGFLTVGIGFQSSIEGESMTGKQAGFLAGCSTSQPTPGAYVNDICLGGKYDIDKEKWLLDIQMPAVTRWLAAGGTAIGL
jgi:hypothetical protein